jgi:hypothetical protein
MAQHEASRTLVKSPPELWTECSDATSLARHLGEFGEIRITRLEPETAVAWEGERVSGTVRIEPSGWGTRVTLTAVEPELAAPEPEPEVRVPDPEPMPVPEPIPLLEPTPVAEPEPVAEQPVPPPPPPERPRSGFVYRLRLLFKPERAVVKEPESKRLQHEPAPKRLRREPEPAPAPAPPPPAPPEREPSPDYSEPERPVAEGAGAEQTPDASKVLASALESLGRAHHRPFSRT